MKRITIILALLAPLPAWADEPKVAVSMSLLEEVFRSLSTQPYANVAATIAKLQTEIQQQKAPPSVSVPAPKAPVPPEPSPPEPK